MSSDTEPSARFEPLQPASRWRLVAAFVLGPFLWLVALTAAVIDAEQTALIGLAFVVTAGSFLIALIVLAAMRAGRRRQERRYVDRG